MNLIDFFQKINEANDIIKNIKLPTKYTTEPKPKSIYLPCNIMANIMSYIPTPLDHHKKKLKSLNEDFEIIKYTEYTDHFETWRLSKPRRSTSFSYLTNTPLSNQWNKKIINKRLSIQRTEELETISPKLDRILTEWKTKKNIINNLVSKGIVIDSYSKREKKADFINSIKSDMIHKFIWPNLRNRSRTVEDFLYSL